MTTAPAPGYNSGLAPRLITLGAAAALYGCSVRWLRDHWRTLGAGE